MEQLLPPAPADGLTAGTYSRQAPPAGKPLSALSPRTPKRAGRIRALWIAGGIVLAGGLLYAGFLTWVKTTSPRTIADAERLLGRGDPAAARESLGWLLWSQPDHADALMLLGKCLEAEQDLDAAAEAFGRVPVDSSRHEEASFCQAVAYLNRARIETADAALVKHLKRYPRGGKHPHSEAAHEELKWLYFNMFRRRELEQLLTASLERRPGDFTLLFHLLYSEFRPQVEQEAVGFLKQIDQKQPGQPSVQLALAHCHWKLGETEAAWQQLEAALESRPEHLETRLVAADFLLEQDQLDSAETLLSLNENASSSLGGQFQRDDRWWSLRSRLAQLRGKGEAALEHLGEAIALRPFERQHLHRRGTLLQVLGRAEEAAKAFADAKQIEQCESRLATIVLSGELERPSVDLCLQVADLYEKRGRKLQATGWRYVAGQLAREAAGRGSTVPAGAGGRSESASEFNR
ncbi:MAG: tetratricopeptide repeat protein [Planctomycetota bacterium]